MEVRNAVDFSRLPPVTLCKKIYIPPWGFPGGSDSKESACNAGDLGWEDNTGGGNDNRSSILAWRATVHGVTKSLTQLSDPHTHPFLLHIFYRNTIILQILNLTYLSAYFTLPQQQDEEIPFQVQDCKPANRLTAKSSRWDLTWLGGSGVKKPPCRGFCARGRVAEFKTGGKGRGMFHKALQILGLF